MCYDYGKNMVREEKEIYDLEKRNKQDRSNK